MTKHSFPVIVNTSCKNIDRIFPSKHQIVADICKIAPQYKEIKRLYIFGSSVTPDCNKDSDTAVSYTHLGAVYFS